MKILTQKLNIPHGFNVFKVFEEKVKYMRDECDYIVIFTLVSLQSIFAILDLFATMKEVIYISMY